MSKKQETAAMALMRAAGKNYRRIGDVYGVAPSAVGQRLRRAEKAPVKLGTKTTRLDKNRLVVLYESERLPLVRIAAALGVSEGVVKRALKFHRIPVRPRLKPGGKYFDRMRNLIIGGSVEIDCPAKYAGRVLRNTARLLGIKILIRKLGSARFEITRIDPADTSETFTLARIDKEYLEAMYCAQNLRLDQIAVNLECGIQLVRKALRFYKIEKRRRLWGNGKYTGVFKLLEAGETVELECLAKHPQTNLHTIASRIGIKISLRKSTRDRFKITRL